MHDWTEWAKKQGLATVLVMIGVGFFTGWIPSPLKTTAELFTLHAVQMDEFIKESRYQTALLAVVCTKIATEDQCFRALMEEHKRGIQTPKDRHVPLLQADQGPRTPEVTRNY